MNGVSYSSLDVLVVDGSFEMRAIIRNMLRNANVGNIRDAMRTDVAKEMIQENCPGLIIADWSEDCDGLDLTHWVRYNNLIKSPYVPIIIMSNHISENTLLQVRDAGVNGFLMKPFSGNKLHAQIRKIVERPRFYIDNDGYRGPCRRAKSQQGEYHGVERRQMLETGFSWMNSASLAS